MIVVTALDTPLSRLMNRALLLDCRIRNGGDALEMTAADHQRQIDDKGPKPLPLWYTLGQTPAMTQLRRHLTDETGRYLRRFRPDLTGRAYRLDGWMNWYPKGEHIPLHDHGTVPLVVTYYPLGQGVLRFPGRAEVCTLPGTMVLFPGNYAHESLPNEHDIPRVVLTSNLVFADAVEDAAGR